MEKKKTQHKQYTIVDKGFMDGLIFTLSYENM